MKRTLVLWDIDGTLIVTRNAGSRAMEIAFERHFGRPGDLSGIEWAGRTDTSLAPEILRVLKPGGRFLVEIGFDQRVAVEALFRQAGALEVETLPDLSTHDRVVTGKKNPLETHG